MYKLGYSANVHYLPKLGIVYGIAYSKTFGDATKRCTWPTNGPYSGAQHAV